MVRKPSIPTYRESWERTVWPDGDHSMRNVSLIRSISCKRAFEMSIACLRIWHRAEVVHLCGICFIDLQGSSLVSAIGLLRPQDHDGGFILASAVYAVNWTTHIAKVGEGIVYERRKTPIYRPCRGEGVAEGEDMVTIDEATSST